MASPTSTTLPTRSATDPDDAIPDEDASETTKLFHERLQAWKHACGYLEDYIKATEKSESDASKDIEKVLKTVSNPLKEGHHFHQQNGGVAEMFDNIRSNTQGISTSHVETAKALKGSVLPIFERLHAEIKSKTKDLDKSAGKASRAVEKARSSTQKHIELLGSNAATVDSRAGSVKPGEDPYLLQRQVYHRLHKQIIEENNNRDDMISVQNEFAGFEAHVIQTMQQGLQQFNQVMARQSEASRNMYGDMVAAGQRIPPTFEWDGFVHRNNHILIDPNGSKRSIENVNFPNQDHQTTRPLIAGSLERKGKLLKRYETGYYVVTPSKYLHEFKTDDDFAKEPSPENTLYLPDCLIGSVDGTSFNIKGKDQSKGALNKMSMSHEFSFKAHTPEDARKWHDVILSVSGGASSSTPSSPVVGGGSFSSTSPTTSQTTGSIGSPATPTTASTLPEKDLAGEPVYHSPTTAESTTTTKEADYAPLSKRLSSGRCSSKAEAEVPIGEETTAFLPQESIDIYAHTTLEDVERIVIHQGGGHRKSAQNDRDMAEAAKEESSKVESAASSPDSNSGAANGLKAPKDRNCPFCAQAFTSSSLGRHLDLYIKPRNPKAPDGVHDVDEIRKIRGGITRRQPRTNTKTQSHRGDGEDKRGSSVTEPPPESRASDGERETSPHDGRMHTFFNAANWQATGVINNLPPRESSLSASHTPQSRAHRPQDARHEDAGPRMFYPGERHLEAGKLDDAAETGRAAELALRELLGSLEAAAKKSAESPKLFEGFDFFALSFPGLCLAMLPPPPAIFSSTPFSVAHTWSVTPPGEAQRAALYRALHEHIAAACNGNPDAVPDSVGFRHRVHLDGAFEHWETLSETDRAAAWTLELGRAFSREHERTQRLTHELEVSQQRVKHLEAEYDRISRCQLPREYLLHPPNTVPISSAMVNELKPTGVVARAAEADYDADALLRRWKAAVKATTKPPRPPPQPHHVEVRRSELKTDIYMTGSVWGVNGPMPREQSATGYSQAISHTARRSLGAVSSPQVANVEEIESDARPEQSSSPANHAALVKFRNANNSPSAEVNANGKRPLRPSSVNGRSSVPRIYKERPI